MSAWHDSDGPVLVADDGPVRIVTLNRPERKNAVSAELHAALTAVWGQLAADRKARAVVLTGKGSAFCAGADRDWLTDVSNDPEIRWYALEEARRLVSEMLRFPLPVVAAVNGAAVGLGSSLVSLCDMVLMSEDSYLADPHVALGVAAGDGAVATWPFLMGMLRAKEYLFTGDKIPAVTAEQLGLANRVVPGDTLLSEAVALAHRLAGLPAGALRATKRALNLQIERAALGAVDFATAAESEHFTLPELRARLDPTPHP